MILCLRDEVDKAGRREVCGACWGGDASQAGPLVIYLDEAANAGLCRRIMERTGAFRADARSLALLEDVAYEPWLPSEPDPKWEPKWEAIAVEPARDLRAEITAAKDIASLKAAVLGVLDKQEATTALTERAADNDREAPQ